MSRYDFSEVYRGLKDFQKTTVDYVFRRMYLDADPAVRFLVADEVGLGKTLVARGLIAKAIEHLEDKGTKRIDVVYICSNSDIARQNISRLNVTGRQEFAYASRITLLALELQNLSKNRLNFVSFTPGTSFDLKSNLGMQEERILLYWLIKKAWGPLVGTKKGPKRVFQGNVQEFARWDQRLAEFARRTRPVDPAVVKRFVASIRAHDKQAALEGRPMLKKRFKDLAAVWTREKKDRPWAEHHARNVFVGELRNLLARTCISALEPDLVILDEFQRFRHLLDGESESARLAHELFNYSDEHSGTRVLLLSATPYKMYTMSDESADDDHYVDFLRTVGFLMHRDTEDLERSLEDMRRRILLLGTGNDSQFSLARDRVEQILRRVMCRTERLASTDDRNGMLVQIARRTQVAPAELRSFVALDRAASKLEAQNPLQLWKSSPYFPNFWHDYQIGKRFEEARKSDRMKVAAVGQMLAGTTSLIPWSDVERFRQLDPGSGRLSGLFADTIDKDLWRLLWLPPAAPYYELTGAFSTEAARLATKRLVFSAWNVVPRVVSAIVSYEAERRMVALDKGRTYRNAPEDREKITEALRFPKKVTGMTAFALMYPGPALARLGDPLAISRDLSSDVARPTENDVLREAERRVMDRFRRKYRKYYDGSGGEDVRWYWAAPLLLDFEPDVQDWLLDYRAADRWTGADRSSEGFEAHLERAAGYMTDEIDPLGRPPEDLGKILALLAVGGPANVALRALATVDRGKPTQLDSPGLRNAAARVAWAFRSLFNIPEVQALLRGTFKKGPYWQKVLRYATDGCLQSVLDEYVHVLVDFEGLRNLEPQAVLDGLSRTIGEVIAVRPADLTARDPLDSNREHRMRTRFALPFGQHHTEQEGGVQRSVNVRRAFNSPFWPFVLSTTSVGQEGLDFHLYCHAVVHWNLPANPVDLEQREGRVHRYMGHAVRKNLAAAHGAAAFNGDNPDPWAAILESAIASRAAGQSDIIPYWIFKGEASIERHVPSVPLSREVGRLADLRRSLVIYRLVFGQPRQEELIDLIQRSTDPEKSLPRISVDLQPRPQSPDTLLSR